MPIWMAVMQQHFAEAKKLLIRDGRNGKQQIRCIYQTGRAYGLFVNADSGFDSKHFRSICKKWGVIPNVAFNYRNGENKDEFLLDDLLYKQRYVIERTNAWIDSFRSLLNRFDITISSWKSFNYIAFMIILFKKIKTNKKSR